MITIASCILFLGFYTSYYTSKRVPLSYNLGFEKWMQKNQIQTKIIGLSLFFTAYLLCIYSRALGSGSLLFFIELMTIGSLIIILKPLNIISNKTILLLFIIMGIIEMYN